MKKLELVFIPVPGFGHLVSTIELAKLFLGYDERFSIRVLVISSPSDPDLKYTHSLAALDSRIRYTHIPSTQPLPQSSSSPVSFEKLALLFVESHKSQVEQAVSELLADDSIQLVGLVLDMFCTCMIDVAEKFRVPSYIFFTTNAAFLGFLLHLPVRHDRVGVAFDASDPDLVVPSYANPVPVNLLPRGVFDKVGGAYEAWLYHGTKISGPEIKGIIVNSIAEIEPHAIGSIMASRHTVYPVGPLLNHTSQNKSTGSGEIMSWLDSQPPKSVLFLCFGRMGSFYKPQLAQMAMALERSGHRFLWSIRQPPPIMDSFETPSDYADFGEVLPNGFLGRTEERGLVCGWVPQVEVLAHGSVKGFVSHCGWNSILESLWYGVPIATWPLYAEQRLNAFVLVRELELAVELTLSQGEGELVTADQIERAVNWLMDDKNPVRERVKKMSEKSRQALTNGGSSFMSLGKLVEDMLQNCLC